jgi:pimeloyl-ACP methyl ester carboxylesterase
VSASRGDSQFPTIPAPGGAGATGDAGGSRRAFLLAAAAASAGLSIRAGDTGAETGPLAEVSGTAHWTVKRAGSDNVKLFLWRKQAKNRVASDKTGTILFVHGSSVSATPVFDLQIPGKPEVSTMDWFARRGYDTWCVDCEGYGRSDKWRPVSADVSCGADDLAAASEYILSQSTDRRLLLYGASSGALRAGLFAQRHAERVQRLALDALVWTGEGSPTLAERKKRLEEYRASNRRPIDRAFVRSIFTRDHPDTSDLTVVEAFADAVLALDKSVPTGTYVDMSANLPVIDPEKISVPVLVMRGQWDGIASFQDLANFFAKLPNPDKQFVVMPGIAHTSTRSKNWALVYHLLDAYFSQPAPVYTG